MAGKHRENLDPMIALSSGDFALSGGFGATASVGSVSGSDGGGRFTITSAGAGQAANPTCTLTFKTPWAKPPAVAASRGGGSQRTVSIEVVSVSETQVVFALLGTPVAAETYVVSFVAVDSP
jgi:hypothetical protein